MLLSDKKESPIRGITGLGGGIASYIFYGSGADGNVEEISRSVRFSSDNDAYMSRIFSTGNRRTWTWSGWVKRGTLDTNQNIFGTNSATGLYFQFEASNTFRVLDYTGSVARYQLRTTQVFRDPGAWIHIVFALDTTLATANDRMKLYINGEQVTTIALRNNPTQDYQGIVNSAISHTLGRLDAQYYFDGYLADVHFIDGQALAATNFGEFDDNGVWQPVAYTGTYGTNGFHLDFSDNSSATALGTDSSGQNNNWSVYKISPQSGFAPTVPSNNYNDNTLGFYLNGNPPLFLTKQPNGVNRSDSVLHGGSVGSSWSVNDVLQWAIDWNGGKIWFGINNGWYSGNPSTGSNPSASSVDVQTLYLGLAYNSSNFQLQVPTSPSYTPPSGFSYWGGSSLNNWNDIWSVSGTKQGGCPDIFNTPIPTSGKIYIEAIIKGGTNVYACVGLMNLGGTFSSSDSLIESPTNGDQTDTGVGGEIVGNYATLNPLAMSNGTYSKGNLQLATQSGNRNYRSTIGVTSGKWYWEVTPRTGTTPGMIGLVLNSKQSEGVNLNGAGAFSYYFNGNKQGGNSGSGVDSGYGAGFTYNNVIGVALDLDSSPTTLTFYKDGSSQGVAFNPNPALGYWHPAVSSGSGTNTTTFEANFGQRPFAHSAPSGFKCLCTANLDDPTIADGSTVIDAVPYTGASGTQTISSINFSPDFVWIKSRTAVDQHCLFDAVRGPLARLQSNSSNTETSVNQYGSLTAFNSDGFTLTAGTSGSNQTHASGTGYVAWTWDAGANSNKTYTVKVVSDSGNKYRFDDFGTSAVTLELEEGSTYVFDASDSSVDGHPFVLGTSANSNEYSTGVTYRLDGSVVTYAAYTSGFTAATTRTLTITVPASAPTLYYWCSVHSGMGGQVNTNTTAGASNFSGSIQSKVRANPSAGFSIVTYTGNAISGATIGHGLNAAPEMILTKNTESTTNWRVYHNTLGNTKALFLSTTGVADTSAVYWNNTSPTSTVFTSGSDDGINGNGNVMIAYCFAPVEGYSSFGSYTGNGTADGPFVYTGFKPSWLLIKASNDTREWSVWDNRRPSYNGVDKYLLANNTNEEGTGTVRMDILSNGFKIRNAAGFHNEINKNFIYAAFAEHPFKTTRAR